MTFASRNVASVNAIAIPQISIELPLIILPNMTDSRKESMSQLGLQLTQTFSTTPSRATTTKPS